MTPKLVVIEGFRVVGFGARTSNREEMNGTSKIGPLWAMYMTGGADLICGALNPDVTFSVYTEYESDFNGEYSVLVGKQAGAVKSGGKLREFEIAAGPYLVFRAESPAPGDIQAAWLSAYEYFGNHRDRPRAYHSDFEKHSSANVELYIGVR